jgi:hypothetical protein
LLFAKAFHPDGNLLIYGRGKIHQWDMAARNRVSFEDSEYSFTRTVRFNQSADQVMTLDNYWLTTWESGSGKRLRSVAGAGYSLWDPAPVFSADGKWALAYEHAGSEPFGIAMLVWDVARGTNTRLSMRDLPGAFGNGHQQIAPLFTADGFLVALQPANLSEVKRLVAVLDIAPKQFLGEMTVCEGEPVPTVREAMDKGKINVLSRPMFLTVENQTVLVNVGKEIEFPPGSGKTRQVGIILQVTVGRANNRQVPVRIVNELASVSKDGATLNIQHMEHSANYPTGERVRIRGGMTESGKELWFDMTITEITSREQLQKLMSRRIGE